MKDDEDVVESWEVTESTVQAPARFTLQLGNQPILYRDVHVESLQAAEESVGRLLAGQRVELRVGGEIVGSGTYPELIDGALDAAGRKPT